MKDFLGLSKHQSKLLAVLRMATGLSFLHHGTMKLFGFPAGPMPQPAILSFMGFAGILEFAGGVAIVLGLFTRPVAFLLSGQMAIAYFLAHAPQSFFPALNGGEAALLFCFIYLFLASAGPGAWSIDGVRNKAAA